jgi:hypothetical protein
MRYSVALVYLSAILVSIVGAFRQANPAAKRRLSIITKGILYGFRRHGVRRALEGSVAEEVVRESDCGVFVVHEKTKRPPERSIPPPPPEIEILVEI